VVLEALGTELSPNPWDELEGLPHSWFHANLPPGQYGRGETPAYRDWKERTAGAQATYYAARREALAAFEGELVAHCSDSYRMWLLTLRDCHWSASRGTPVDVTAGVYGLAVPGRLELANDRLQDAARALGVRPTEPPRLLLASDWS